MLLVKDLMTAEPISIPHDMILRHIIGTMKQNGFRQLPVVDGRQTAGPCIG